MKRKRYNISLDPGVMDMARKAATLKNESLSRLIENQLRSVIKDMTIQGGQLFLVSGQVHNHVNQSSKRRKGAKT